MKTGKQIVKEELPKWEENQEEIREPLKGFQRYLKKEKRAKEGTGKKKIKDE